MIDDFFAIGAEHVREVPSNSFAFKALARARVAYEKHKLEGSPEKDVIAEVKFKAIGAEVDSGDAAFNRGLALVGSPRIKRLALSALTLKAARFPGITTKLASRLAGNWVSVLMYRRCVSSLIDSFFGIGSLAARDDCPPLVDLPRAAAQELAMVSTLAPIIVSNVSVDYVTELLASDSSSVKGAFVGAKVREDVIRSLWQNADKKGGYSKLQSSVRMVLKEHLDELDCPEEVPEVVFEGPFKAPLLYFDFVEIYGGAGVVSKHAAKLGLVVAPVLDLSDSRHYDLKDLRLLEWCIYMIPS